MRKFSDQRFSHLEEWIQENLARRRRWELFVRITGLCEAEWHCDCYNPVVIVSIPRGWNDHISLWASERSMYSLSEPYTTGPPPAGDLIFAEVPTPLAPYCGGYSTDIFASPGTKSWLFCEPTYEKELREIEERLKRAAKTAPPWNEV